MKIIKAYHKATEDIAKVFVKKYFPDEIYGKYTFWVGDQIGGVFSVSDMFLNIDQMIIMLENKAKFEQLYDYYWAEVEAMSEEPPRSLGINFENYIKYGWVNKPDDITVSTGSEK